MKRRRQWGVRSGEGDDIGCAGASRCVFIRAAAVAGIKEGGRAWFEKEEARMKKGGVVQRRRVAEAGTQTDAPLRGDASDATDATDAALMRGVAAWRARVRAAMAALAAVVDEEAGGDAADATDAPGAPGATDAPDAPGGAPLRGGESDEAAEARLRRELGCLGGEEDELSEYSAL